MKNNFLKSSNDKDEINKHSHLVLYEKTYCAVINNFYIVINLSLILSAPFVLFRFKSTCFIIILMLILSKMASKFPREFVQTTGLSSSLPCKMWFF